MTIYTPISSLRLLPAFIPNTPYQLHVFFLIHCLFIVLLLKLDFFHLIRFSPPSFPPVPPHLPYHFCLSLEDEQASKGY